MCKALYRYDNIYKMQKNSMTKVSKFKIKRKCLSLKLDISSCDSIRTFSLLSYTILWKLT